MKRYIRWGLLSTLALLPVAASAADFTGTPNATYISDLGQQVIDIINGILVPVLFAIAFIVFLWGVAKAYIISRGNEAEVKKGHTLILWGLIGFAVMLSIWGLVNIVNDTFGLSGGDIQGDLPKGPGGTTSL
jgi:hypothetical protein